jgi:hypothetical protein
MLAAASNLRMFVNCAGVAELADALDSKSSGRKAVWVRAPPPADCLSLPHWKGNAVVTTPMRRQEKIALSLTREN